MHYKVTHSTTYTYSEKASMCHNQVHLGPRDTAVQTCQNHRVIVRPVPTDREKRTDYFGNQVEYFSVLQPHTKLTVTSTCRVQVAPASAPDLGGSPPWETLAENLRRDRYPATLNARQFIYASPRIPLAGRRWDAEISSSNGHRDLDDSDVIREIQHYAKEAFAPGVTVAQATRELTRRIYTDFEFDARATTLNTPVTTAFKQRRGVCQDFAHIQIACLRSLGLAARYVSGYLRTIPPPGRPRLVGADVSHAWVSVYCGQLGWIDFDPTNDVLPSDSHITVGWGRDYDDVSPVQGVFLGGGKHTMATSVEVECL